MKQYTIYQKRQGETTPQPFATFEATDGNNAKREFAKWVHEQLLESKFGDNYTWHNDESIEDDLNDCRDVSWYTQEGWYDFSFGDRPLVLSSKDMRQGITQWHEDVNAYWFE